VLNFAVCPVVGRAFGPPVAVFQWRYDACRFADASSADGAEFGVVPCRVVVSRPFASETLLPVPERIEDGDTQFVVVVGGADVAVCQEEAEARLVASKWKKTDPPLRAGRVSVQRRCSMPVSSSRRAG